jgi:hypothetical protein
MQAFDSSLASNFIAVASNCFSTSELVLGNSTIAAVIDALLVMGY